MTDETVRFLHDLKLPGMAGCWTSLEETHQLDKISLRDGMQLMLQHERDMRTSNRMCVRSARAREKKWIESLCSSAFGRYEYGNSTAVLLYRLFRQDGIWDR